MGSFFYGNHQLRNGGSSGYAIDHHDHLANQTISFDWQFNAEILFLEKLANEDFGGILKQQLD